MMWDIVVVILVAVALVLSVWEKFSKKKLSVDMRINFSAIRVMCLTVVFTIAIINFMLDMLLLQTTTLKTTAICVLIVWLFFEIWNQTDLIDSKAPKDEEWVD